MSMPRHPVVSVTTLLFVGLALLVPGHVMCACIDGCLCRADSAPKAEEAASCCATRAARACETADEPAPDTPVLNGTCCGKSFVTTDLAVAALPDAPVSKHAPTMGVAVATSGLVPAVVETAVSTPRAPPDRSSPPATLLYGVWRL